jgi:membrane protein
MPLSWSSTKHLVLQTGKEVADDDVPSLSAAIAYYTVFSLPPLLVVVVAVAGAIFGADAVQDVIVEQVGGAVGPGAADEVSTMIEQRQGSLAGGLGAKIAGIAALLFGATGAFGQLQKALNRAWEVEEASGGGIAGIVVKRLLSFGMILTIAFLLLVSLAVSAALSAVGGAAADAFGGVPPGVMQLLNQAVSVAVVAALFALMFKVLPDAEVAWRDVWVGALVTAVLFTLGKFLIGLYLGTANPGSAFGAAGSLALILVWIYYSSLIVLVGAEFTQVWARSHGEGITRDGDGDTVHPLAKERDPAPYSGVE